MPLGFSWADASEEECTDYAATGGAAAATWERRPDSQEVDCIDYAATGSAAAAT